MSIKPIDDDSSDGDEVYPYDELNWSPLRKLCPELITTDPRNDGSVQNRFVCIICDEPVVRNQGVNLPSCGHSHCFSCLRQNFALAAEANKPAYCCEQIDAHLVLIALSPPAIRKYLGAQQTYKSEVLVPCWQCKRVLLDVSIRNGGAFCVDCKTVTCSRCPKKMHGGACGELEGLVRLAGLAEAANWAMCFKCKSLVAKIDGCNHISCRCGSEFCYLCGGPWLECFEGCMKQYQGVANQHSVQREEFEVSQAKCIWNGWDSTELAAHEQQAKLAQQEHDVYVKYFIYKRKLLSGALDVENCARDLAAIRKEAEQTQTKSPDTEEDSDSSNIEKDSTVPVRKGFRSLISFRNLFFGGQGRAKPFSRKKQGQNRRRQS